MIGLTRLTGKHAFCYFRCFTHLTVAGSDAQQGGRKNSAGLIFKGYCSRFAAPPSFLDESIRKNTGKCSFYRLLVDFTQEQAIEFSHYFVSSFLDTL